METLSGHKNLHTIYAHITVGYLKGFLLLSVFKEELLLMKFIKSRSPNFSNFIDFVCQNLKPYGLNVRNSNIYRRYLKKNRL